MNKEKNGHKSLKKSKRATAEYNLAIKFPAVAKQWHPTKNGDVTACDVTPKNGNKAWWICDRKHEWNSVIASRTDGVGCPFCSGRRAGADNNLAVLDPDIARTWHPTKNGKLTPYDVRPGSGKRVWWICGKGHEWDVKVCDRTNRGRICPYCSNKKIGADNNLAVLRPDLAKEWDYEKNVKITPKDVVPGSKKKVWWKCARGHSYKTIVASRNRGVGCPKCSPQASHLEIRLYCELKTIFEDIEMQKQMGGIRGKIDLYIPNLKIAIEVDGGYWHKAKGESDKKKGKQIESKGIMLFRVREQGLAKLSKRGVSYKKSEKHLSIIKKLLRELSTHAIIEKKGNDTIKNYLKTNKLTNKKEYRRLLSCLPGPLPEDSIAQTNPDVAKDWHFIKNSPLIPEMFTAGSNKRVWWKCKNGHEWESVIHHRTSGSGCPVCSNRVAGADNSLAFLYPEIAKEWHPTKNGDLTPFDFTAGSDKKAWWKCSKGHEWHTVIKTRKNGHGCPRCSKNRFDVSKSLGVLYPDLAEEWHPIKNGRLTPFDVRPGIEKKVWWQCAKGHEWYAVIKRRKRRKTDKKGLGCPYCAGKKASSDNNLAGRL